MSSVNFENNPPDLPPPKSEFDKWVEDLYRETYDVEVFGKKFVFRRYYPNSLEKKLREMEPTDQARFILSYTSVEPKLTVEQIERLPEQVLGVLLARYTQIQKENNEIVLKILPELDQITQKKS